MAAPTGPVRLAPPARALAPGRSSRARARTTRGSRSSNRRPASQPTLLEAPRTPRRAGRVARGQAKTACRTHPATSWAHQSRPAVTRHGGPSTSECRPRARARWRSGRAAPSGSRGQLQPAAVHGAEDIPVAGAAAVVAGEVVEQLVVAGVGILVEQSFHGEDVAGRAVAALERALFEKRFLDRVQPAPLAEPFNRLDAPPVQPGRKRQAGGDRPAVEEDGTRAAHGGAAAFAHARELELLAQHV